MSDPLPSPPAPALPEAAPLLTRPSPEADRVVFPALLPPLSTLLPLPGHATPQDIAACRGWEEDTQDAIVRWRPDGTRTGVNAAYCRRYGRAPHLLIGQNLLPGLPLAQRLRVARRAAALTPADPTWVEQTPSTTPLGRQTWQEWHSRGFFDEKGQLIEIQSIGREVTLQKELSLAMDEISRSLLTIRGGRYFEHVVRHLSRVLEADVCYAGELVQEPGEEPRFRCLAVIVDGVLETLPDGPLKGTPLIPVMEDGFASLPRRASALYPYGPLIQRIRAESYVAAAMRDHDGNNLGAVGVLYRQPRSETDFYTAAVVRLTAAVGASRLLQHRESRRREAVEHQLRESQKMDAIGQLAGGIAHDFNNLLTVLSGHAALLQSAALPDAAAAESVREIAEGTARASSLTRQLLMFSRRQVMQFGVHDLNQIVRGMSRLLARLCPEHILLRTDLHPTALWVEADPGMLEQILLNLVVNSRDAMPQGGTLTLLTRPQEASAETALTALPFARLSVVDNGCGIAPAHLGRIFEPFYTTKPAGEGTGIGLATVYTIVEQHQGHIKAESTPGTGTTMHIHLPSVSAPVLPSTAAPIPLAAPAGQGETVLVVEDEAPLRMLVRRVLEKQGYRVVEAASGRLAMDFSPEDVARARLLITDLVMPEGVNGWETADHLRARNPALRVIYTSGYDAHSAGQAVSLPQGSGFIQKPWQVAELAGSIRAMLDS